MPIREELIDALAQLEPIAFEHVITSAYQERHPSDSPNGKFGMIRLWVAE